METVNIKMKKPKLTQQEKEEFCRKLEDEKPIEHNVSVSEIKNFWETMWTKREDSTNVAGLETYLVEHLSGEELLEVFPTFEEYKEVFK